MTELTAEIARELLRYEPETGKLFWKQRDRKWFKSERALNIWNARYAGTEAFYYQSPFGYRRGTILKSGYQAHRVIWLIQAGDWPKNEIDHINRIRNDNRWTNLREVGRAENAKNLSKRVDNASGVTGVSWDKRNRKWFVCISIDSKMINLGRYEKLDEAACARKAAEIKYGFHKNHGKETN